MLPGLFLGDAAYKGHVLVCRKGLKADPGKFILSRVGHLAKSFCEPVDYQTDSQNLVSSITWTYLYRNTGELGGERVPQQVYNFTDWFSSTSIL